MSAFASHHNPNPVLCHCTAKLTATVFGSVHPECRSNVCFGDACVSWCDKDNRLQYGCVLDTDLIFRNHPSNDTCDHFREADLFQCCQSHNCTSQKAAEPCRVVPTTLSAPIPGTSASAVRELTTSASAAPGNSNSIGGVPIATLLITILPVALILTIAIVCLVAVWKYKNRKGRSNTDPETSRSSRHGNEGSSDMSSCPSSGGLSSRSGSNGTAYILPRTLVSEISIEGGPLGIGGFGEVYCGRWADRRVAVKRFTDEKSFKWERHMLMDWNLRHPNIIEFYAAELEHAPLMTRYWLVTEYHPHRSLQAYLRDEAFGKAELDIDPSPVRPDVDAPNMSDTAELGTQHEFEVMRLVKSVVAGLDHLHARYGRPSRGTKASENSCSSFFKPVVAHRDLKSQNVLVRSDLTCCIADFGQAVYQDPNTDKVCKPVHLLKDGTTRYLPPEFLDDTAEDALVSFLCQDMYSLGLVIWEVIQCCPLPGQDCPSYQVPYATELPMANPSKGQAKRIVCVAGKRPSLSPDWEKYKPLAALSSIMTSCWSRDPSCRPTSNGVAKKLAGFPTSAVQSPQRLFKADVYDDSGIVAESSVSKSKSTSGVRFEEPGKVSVSVSSVGTPSISPTADMPVRPCVETSL